MKFIFIFIFSFIPIDSIAAYPCGIKCKDGRKLKCPERKGWQLSHRLPVIRQSKLSYGFCQFLLNKCKCVNEKDNNELKIKDRINNISSNK